MSFPFNKKPDNVGGKVKHKFFQGDTLNVFVSSETCFLKKQLLDTLRFSHKDSVSSGNQHHRFVFCVQPNLCSGSNSTHKCYRLREHVHRY